MFNGTYTTKTSKQIFLIISHKILYFYHVDSLDAILKIHEKA